LTGGLSVLTAVLAAVVAGIPLFYVSDSADGIPDPNVPASAPSLSISTWNTQFQPGSGGGYTVFGPELIDTDDDGATDFSLPDIIPTASGSAVSGSMGVRVDTNNPTGYTLFLKAENGDNRMTNSSNSSYYIEPVSGTMTNPQTLGINTWGFAIPRVQKRQGYLGSTVYDPSFSSLAFDDEYTDEDNNQNSTSRWAAVPASDTVIKTTDIYTTQVTAYDFERGWRDTEVFYGVRADVSQAAGKYKGSVIYTAIANDVPAPVITSVNPNSGPIGGGTEIKIEGENFYGYSFVVKVQVGGVDCTSFWVGSTGGAWEINCTVPPGTTAGAADVSVTTVGGGTTVCSGCFTYQDLTPTITMPNATAPQAVQVGSTISMTITGTNLANPTSVQLVGGGNTYTCNLAGGTATYINCWNTSTPPRGIYNVIVNTPGGSATSANALIIADTFQTFNINDTYYRNVTAVDANSSQTNKDNSIKYLIDSRDGKYYRIRKFRTVASNPSAADTTLGWWWMIDNLALSGQTLTSADTNMATGRSFVIPANAILNAATRNTNGFCDTGAVTVAGGGYLTCSDTATGAFPSAAFRGFVDPGDGYAYCEQRTNPQKCGYMYNWYTVGVGAVANAAGFNFSQDICPKGWRMPLGNTDANPSFNDFAWLNGLMNGENVPQGVNGDTSARRLNWRMDSAVAGVADTSLWQGTYTGYYNTARTARGTQGTWWSATSAPGGTGNYSNFMGFTTSAVSPSDDIYTRRAQSVRCVPKTTSNQNTTLQNFNAGSVAAKAIPSVSQSSDQRVIQAGTLELVDTRDGKTYRVRKFSGNVNNPYASSTANGHWWMIDNLALSGRTLTSADTNTLSNFAIPTNSVQGTATHGNGVCDSGARTSGNFLTCNGTSTINDTNIRFRAWTSPTSTYCDSTLVGSDSMTNCGYLYNWYTATAGSGLSSTPVANANAVSDICPKGWRLPTGGTAGDFAWLNASMANGSATAPSTGTTAMTNWGPISNPNDAGRPGDSSIWRGVWSGWFYNGALQYQGSGSYGGFYWSSTSATTANSSSMYFGSGGSAINYSIGKDTGQAVRCVYKASDSFQTFSKAAAANSNAAAVNVNSTQPQIDTATRTLVDERDGKQYRVRKFTTNASNPNATNTAQAWWLCFV